MGGGGFRGCYTPRVHRETRWTAKRMIRSRKWGYPRRTLSLSYPTSRRINPQQSREKVVLPSFRLAPRPTTGRSGLSLSPPAFIHDIYPASTHTHPSAHIFFSSRCDHVAPSGRVASLDHGRGEPPSSACSGSKRGRSSSSSPHRHRHHFLPRLVRPVREGPFVFRRHPPAHPD